jgi:hypothetical protein
MAQSGPFIGLTPEHVTVDEEGRVIITDPQVREMIQAAKPVPVPVPTTNQNCGAGHCNYAAGCGVHHV